jgi:histidyl-tRNA synthetase
MSGGKVDLPALGFGMGDVVLCELLKDRGLLPKFDAGVEVFVLVEDESLRAESLRFIEDLRLAGCAVDYSLTPLKPDKQFKRAVELNASFTCRLERDTSGMIAARVKNLKDRSEQILAAAAAVDLLRSRSSVR